MVKKFYELQKMEKNGWDVLYSSPNYDFLIKLKESLIDLFPDEKFRIIIKSEIK